MPEMRIPAPADPLAEDSQPITVRAMSAVALHPRDIMLGRPVLTPLQVIETYGADEWERLVEEWAAEALPVRYAAVHRAPGSGDKGRDVIGYLEASPSTSPYDNYQCKHYDEPLTPAAVWLELGKLCWYTFCKVYRVPRHYYFVAPKGVGPTLLRYLEQPDTLRAGLVQRWDDSVATKIEHGRRIALDGALREYVLAFDFSIVRALPPLDLLEQHATTRYHAMRFGGGLRRRRPEAMQPPAEIAAEEAVYVRHLLDAYAESLGIPLTSAADLAIASVRLRAHLTRQREWFFKAATLRQFERDSLPSDAGFVDLMNQVYDAVIDTHARPYADGYVRLEATLELAAQLHISRYVLRDELEPADLKGVCHHLTNERDDFCWCDRKDAA